MTDYPIKSPRKLIEVALPLDAINAACAREKPDGRYSNWPAHCDRLSRTLTRVALTSATYSPEGNRAKPTITMTNASKQWSEATNRWWTFFKSVLDGDGHRSGCVCQFPIKCRRLGKYVSISCWARTASGVNRKRERLSDRYGPVTASTVIALFSKRAKSWPPASFENTPCWRFLVK